jgi:hypothetical protein
VTYRSHASVFHLWTYRIPKINCWTDCTFYSFPFVYQSVFVPVPCHFCYDSVVKFIQTGTMIPLPFLFWWRLLWLFSVCLSNKYFWLIITASIDKMKARHVINYRIWMIPGITNPLSRVKYIIICYLTYIFLNSKISMPHYFILNKFS